MHMADALISPPIAGVMYACSGIVGAYCIKKIEIQEDFKENCDE